MSSEWVNSSSALADICSDISYGYTASAESEPVGPKFLRITDIQGGIVSWATVPHCQIEQNQISKYLLHEGDIVVARTGNSTGENFIFKGGESAVFASYLIRFRVDHKKANPSYVWYSMRSPSWWEFVNSSKTGSAQAGANAKVLGSFELTLPSLESQQSVVSIFQALDDRIALLREINTTLEAIAQALFKSWFVDFDPVRAKQEGREPEGMNADTAALFPDSFEESELGLVPKGWRVLPLGEAVESVGGGTPSTKNTEYWEPAEFAWTTPKDLSGLQSPVLLKTERLLSAKGVSNVSSGLLPKGTLLLSSRAPIGYLAIAQIPLAINQGYIAILPSSQLPPLYMLFWCKQNMEIIKSRSNGSTFMEISKKAFRPIPALVPPVAVIHNYMDVAGPVFDRLIENEQQAQTLITLRDTLLPRLISGQLRITGCRGDY